MELASFVLRQRAGGSLRVNTSQVKRLVRVDVAYPRDPTLVQKPRPDRRNRSGEVGVQSPCGEARREWFGAETPITLGPFRLVHHLQGSEAAHVVVDQHRAWAQGESYGGVSRPSLVPSQDEAAGHTKVHDQDRALGKVRDDVFPPSVDGLESSAPQTGGKIPRRLTNHVRVQHLEAFDRLSGQCGEEAANNRFDLREFGHDSCGRRLAGA